MIKGKYIVRIAHGVAVTDNTYRNIIVSAGSELAAVEIAGTLCGNVQVGIREWEPEWVVDAKPLEYRTSGKFYLRMGEIPENEQSINWMSVSYAQQSDYNWYRDCGDDHMTAVKKAIPNYLNKFELGVSVFELIAPICRNAQQERDLHSYIKEGRTGYIVIGDELMERGFDNEPLLHNIQIISTLSAEDLASFDPIEKSK